MYSNGLNSCVKIEGFRVSITNCGLVYDSGNGTAGPGVGVVGAFSSACAQGTRRRLPGFKHRYRTLLLDGQAVPGQEREALGGLDRVDGVDAPAAARKGRSMEEEAGNMKGKMSNPQHAWTHPKELDTAVVPAAATAAVRTTVLPPGPTAAVALYVLPSEAVTENHAHWDAGTPSSVWQWSAAATSEEGTLAKETVTATSVPEAVAVEEVALGAR